MKFFQYIRTAVFNILFLVWGACFMIPVLVSLVFPAKVIQVIAAVWAIGVVKLFEFVIGAKIKIEGKENISKKTVLYLSKHQSTLETCIFFYYLHQPVFIVKKELLFVPMFGWGVHKAGFIPIDRKRGREAMDKISKKMNAIKKSGRSVVIFPEGTRAPFGEIVGYKAGAAYTVWQGLGEVDVVPIALNTGKFWPKKRFLKTSGQIIVKILPPVKFDKNIEKHEFIRVVEEKIETEQKKFEQT